MGFLLLQYEYQRANSKVNSYQRTGITLNNKMDRLTKRISKMEKMFEKQKSNIQTKWDAYSRNASSILSRASSEGSVTCNADMVQGAINGIVVGGHSLGEYVRVQLPDTRSMDASAARATIAQALSTAIAQANAVLQNLIEAVKESQTNAIEEQEEAQMAPINDRQIDIEADQTLNDTLTTMWTTRRDNAKEKLGEGIKESMSGFGIK